MGDEQRESRRRADSASFLRFFLIVVVVSGVMGGVGYSQEQNAVLAFLLALSVGTILLMVEVRYRLAISKEDLARGLALKEETQKHPEASRSALWQAVADFTKVTQNGNRLAHTRAEEILANFGTEMSRLREGNLEVSLQHSYVYLVRLYEEVQRTFFATLLVRLADVWFRPNPQEYVNQNLRALARGVKMTRVFIVQGVGDLNDEVVDIIKKLTAGGADIRIAFEENLASELVVDMFLFDDRVVLYTDLAPGDRARSCRLHTNEVEVQKARMLQDRLVRESVPAMEFLARYHPTPSSQAPGPAAMFGGLPS